MRLSNKKREKISEQILAFLYSINPKPTFTSYIAQEIARDEEFVKNLLLDLKSKNLVIEIDKNSSGTRYKKRKRWRLSDASYNAYRKHQPISNPF